MADARLMVGVVGAPEGAKFAEKIGTLVGHLSRSEPIDRVASRFLADCREPVANFIDGDIPGDAIPLAVGELHGVFQPTLPGDQFAHRRTLGAMRSAVDR